MLHEMVVRMGRAIQRHHVSYDPEIVETIYRGEHELLSKLAWYERKTVSAGFVRCLKNWVVFNERRAEELEC